MAALVASKVYYYLGEYDESLSFALGAGKVFQTEAAQPGAEEYAETVVCKRHPVVIRILTCSLYFTYSKSH